jgi:pimeloyl-ACP methyl ester carboxylesterase
MLVVPAPGPDVLVLLPGFMIAASAYTALAESVADAGSTVIVPQLYRRGFGALAGRAPVAAEAAAAAALVRRVAADKPGARVHLGGHSRGGQAAWRAAGPLAGGGLPASVVLLDPVDGQGRRPSGPTSTAVPAAFTVPTLVVGAGVGGRCAPEGINHWQFARATPAARHLLVEGLGHADLLVGRGRELGRRLCGGGDDPDAARAVLAALINAWITAVAASAPLPTVPGTAVLR